MDRRKLRASAALGAVLAIGATAAVAQGTTIRIVGTSDVTDSGLEPQMVNGFTGSTYFQTGDTISYTAVGTGKAITQAKQGLADLILVHSPLLEAPFVALGYSNEAFGRSVVYNNYVVAGPTSDPANVIAHGHGQDAVRAFVDIAADGATQTNSTFVSRNDTSGTNTQEETMWGQTKGLTNAPALQLAPNGAGSPTLYQPVGSGTTFPAWYVVETAASGNQTQGNNLKATNSCTTFTGRTGCYTLTDYGTYLNLHNQGLIPNLTIVSQNNSSTAIGGSTELVNPFHTYILKALDPVTTGGTYPSGVTPNVAAATRFVNYITDRGFQLGVVPTYLPGAFTADAFAQQLTGTAVPAKGSSVPVATGSVQTLKAVFYYAPPPSPRIGGLPFQFQDSTNGGSTWTNVGGTGLTTAADGTATTTFTVPSGTNRIRVVTASGFYDDSALATRFSPFVGSLSDFGSYVATP